MRPRGGPRREASLGRVQIDDPDAWLAVEVEWGDCQEVTSVVARQYRDHHGLTWPNDQPELVSDDYPMLLVAVSKRVGRIHGRD
jgi:hypothetical protein